MRQENKKRCKAEKKEHAEVNEIEAIKMGEIGPISFVRHVSQTDRQRGRMVDSGGNGTRLSAAAPAVPDPNGHRQRFRPSRVR